MRRSPYAIFVLASLAVLTPSLQFAMISIALPDLITDLDAPLRWVGWVITIYTVTTAIAMPISGKLSDELGRRTVFAGAFTIFTVGSLGAAFAPNVYVLIAARALQGLGGGSVMPSAYGVIADAFPERRVQMLGLLSAIFPIGSIVGPNVGGVIVDTLGWRWTFLFNLPFALLVLAGIAVLVPPAAESKRRPIDFSGAVLMAVSLVALLYGFTELGQRNADPNLAVVAACFAIALLVGFTFVRYEGRQTDPILDMSLMRRREFAIVNALNFCYGMVLFGATIFVPLYAQTAYGLTPSEAGAIQTPRALVLIATSALSSLFLQRTGYRRPIIAALIGTTGYCTLMSLELHDVSLGFIDLPDVAYLTIVTAIGGLAIGIGNPAMNNASIELAPERISAITGMRGMFRSLGGAIGVALVVLVTETAPTQADGIERAFVGLAILAVVCLPLALGVPGAVGRSAQESTGKKVGVKPAGG